MKLQSCKRIAGGRCETPENTIAHLEPLLRAKHEYRLIEEEVAEHLHWSALFIDELEFRAMGKGTSELWSRAGALAESAEWMAARAVTALPGYQVGHQDEITNAFPIEKMLPHVSTLTPALLERIRTLDCSQHWVDGISLFSNETVSLPIEYIRQISGPNGLASGNRLEEALVHAMTEIFERRSHITVLKNRMVIPTIDPASIPSRLIQELLAFVQDKGIEVTIKDLSFGGELPCIGAYFKDSNIPEEFQFHHFFKVGAAFDLELALTRVFTEYVQGRRLDEFIQARPDDQERVLKDDFRNLKCVGDDTDIFLSSFMFGFVPFTRADFLEKGDVVPFDRGHPSDDCLDDIQRALDIYANLGLDCFVVDFTDPAVGFPVVQVVVPGYSDALPYHPHDSHILYRRWTRDEVLNSYPRGW
ncbi:MAG: YcaO-like family protein [Kiritimatiellae bacterium]|nr:YcaO-like family protein [Kiritimatiellia bacterium]